MAYTRRVGVHTAYTRYTHGIHTEPLARLRGWEHRRLWTRYPGYRVVPRVPCGTLGTHTCGYRVGTQGGYHTCGYRVGTQGGYHTCGYPGWVPHVWVPWVGTTRVGTQGGYPHVWVPWVGTVWYRVVPCGQSVRCMRCRAELRYGGEERGSLPKETQLVGGGGGGETRNLASAAVTATIFSQRQRG